MIYDFLSPPDRFKPREFIEFSGRLITYSLQPHNDVRPSLNARLILPYCSRAKGFSYFSSRASI